MFSVSPLIIKTFLEITLMKCLVNLCQLNPLSGQQQPNEEKLSAVQRERDRVLKALSNEKCYVGW